MKTMKLSLLIAILMIFGLTACSTPDNGSSSKSKDTPKPADTTVYLKFNVPVAGANMIESALVPDNPVWIEYEPLDFNMEIGGKEVDGALAYSSYDGSEIPKWSYAYTLTQGISPLALNPGPSPTFVGISGYAIRQAGCQTYSPYEPACIRDVTAYCPGGVCNIPLNVSKADWLDVNLYYGGMNRPDGLEVSASGVTTPLNRFMAMKINQSLPSGDPNQREWLTACFFVDQAPTGTITVRTDNPNCILTPADLWSVEIFITGNSFGNSLDDVKYPYDGTTIHDGRILIRGTVLIDTLVPPTTDDFPQILYGVTAYSHTIAVMAPSQGGILAVYSSSRAPTAPAGDIAPLLGGVYLRTRRLSAPAVIVCNVSNQASELHHVIANGTITQGGSGLVVNMLYFDWSGINLVAGPTAGCPIQPPTDNRLQALSGT